MCEREIKIRHLAENSDREICRQKAGRRRRKGRQREGMGSAPAASFQQASEAQQASERSVEGGRNR